MCDRLHLFPWNRIFCRHRENQLTWPITARGARRGCEPVARAVTNLPDPCPLE